MGGWASLQNGSGATRSTEARAPRLRHVPSRPWDLAPEPPRPSSPPGPRSTAAGEWVRAAAEARAHRSPAGTLAAAPPAGAPGGSGRTARAARGVCPRRPRRPPAAPAPPRPPASCHCQPAGSGRVTWRRGHVTAGITRGRASPRDAPRGCGSRRPG